MEYRIRSTGVVVSDQEFRAAHPTISFAAVLTPEMLAAQGADPVLASPAPTVGRWQSAVRDGVVQDGLGNWVYAWRVVDLARPALADEQARMVQVIDLIAKAKRDQVVTSFSAAEMSSWPIKRAEAMLYNASGKPSDAPCLSMEASARGISLADLVVKVLSKSTSLSGMEAAIAGVCGGKQDAIRAAATLDQLMAMEATIADGWPV